jgi:hypothetical protein
MESVCSVLVVDEEREIERVRHWNCVGVRAVELWNYVVLSARRN